MEQATRNVWHEPYNSSSVTCCKNNRDNNLYTQNRHVARSVDTLRRSGITKSVPLITAIDINELRQQIVA